MNFLSAIVPGLRHIRAPLIAGLLLIVALGYHQLAVDFSIEGLLSAAALAAEIGSFPLLMPVLLVAAYLLGLVFIALTSWFFDWLTWAVLLLHEKFRARRILLRARPGDDLGHVSLARVEGVYRLLIAKYFPSRAVQREMIRRSIFYAMAPHIRQASQMRTVLEKLDNEEVIKLAWSLVRNWSVEEMDRFAPISVLTSSYELGRIVDPSSLSQERRMTFVNLLIRAQDANGRFGGELALAVAEAIELPDELMSEMRMLPARMASDSVTSLERWDMLEAEAEFRSAMGWSMIAAAVVLSGPTGDQLILGTASLFSGLVLIQLGVTKEVEATRHLVGAFFSGSLATKRISEMEQRLRLVEKRDE